MTRVQLNSIYQSKWWCLVFTKTSGVIINPEVQAWRKNRLQLSWHQDLGCSLRLLINPSKFFIFNIKSYLLARDRVSVAFAHFIYTKYKYSSRTKLFTFYGIYSGINENNGDAIIKLYKLQNSNFCSFYGFIKTFFIVRISFFLSWLCVLYTRCWCCRYNRKNQIK